MAYFNYKADLRLLQATCLGHSSELGMHHEIQTKRHLLTGWLPTISDLKVGATLITRADTRIPSQIPYTLVIECVLSFLFSRLLPLPTTTWIGIFVIGFSDAHLSDLRNDDERVIQEGFNPPPSLVLLKKCLFGRGLFGETGCLVCSCSINQYVVTSPFPFHKKNNKKQSQLGRAKLEWESQRSDGENFGSSTANDFTANFLHLSLKEKMLRLTVKIDQFLSLTAV